jgi:hypothetical protein
MPGEHFTNVGLEPTGMRQLRLAHNLPDPVILDFLFTFMP